MRISLEGKVALVTGGSRGIGAATVRLLRECGARVVFSYKSEADRAEALAGECGGAEFCRALPQELATAADGNALVTAAAKVFGRVDILVVNHGIWPPHDQPITTMADAQWRGTLGVNLDSVFGLVRAGARQMLGPQAGGAVPAAAIGGEDIAGLDRTAYAGERQYGLGEADAETRTEAVTDTRELLEEAVYSDHIEWAAPSAAKGAASDAPSGRAAISAAVPDFAVQSSGQVRGHIVLVASTAAQRGEAFHADYAASKGALLSLTKSLSSELGPQGILCNCVAPGWVVTEMSAGTLRDPVASKKALAAIPLGRAAEPEEIAGPIAFLCSPWAGFISGEIWNVNGGAVLVG